MAVFPASGGENRINTAFVSVKNNLIISSLMYIYILPYRI